MIEFRASCGHTVRAKDADAGSEIPCRYCGRIVRVPMPEATGLDQLLGPDDTGVRGAQRSSKAGGRRGGTSIDWQGAFGGPQVYRVAMFLVWGAVVVAVLVVGIKLASKNLAPLFRDQPPSRAPAVTADDSGGQGPSADQPRSWQQGRNLLAQLRPGGSGLLITSVPEDLPVQIDWNGQGHPPREMPVTGTTPLHRDLPPGPYKVSVWVSSHDERLLGMPGYGRWFERVEENATIPAKPQFFMEDEASDLQVEVRSDGPWRFRREYETTVETAEWRLLAIPFLPTGPLEDQVPYLPKDPQFELNASQTEEYLDLRNVEGEQRRLLVKVLERMGKALWQDPAGMRYMFRLQGDGTVWAQLVSQGEMEPLALQLPVADRSHLAGYTVADLNALIREARALATVVMLMAEYDRRGEPWPTDRLLRFLPQRWQGDVRNGPDYDEWESASGVDRLRFVQLVAEHPERSRDLLDGLGLALQREKQTAVALAIISLLSEVDDRRLNEYLHARRQIVDRRPKSTDRIVELARLDEALARAGSGRP